MVYLSSVSNSGLQQIGQSKSACFKGILPFGSDKTQKKEQHKPAQLLYEEKKQHPILTSAKIQAVKLAKAFTVYPKKGFEGSKNSNFYEFLTMGTVPYLVGSAMMAGVFGLASRFFDTQAANSSLKWAKKMGAGVAAYGLAKTFSKYLVEAPVNHKYGIDVNLPYRKKIDELPEERNKNNLVSYEYHNAYESVDFPYWDLFYDNKSFGNDRNAYFTQVGKKMGLSDEELEHSDQKVKPLIKEKIIQTKAFSTISSYLWAATAVGIAMQAPFERLRFDPIGRIKDIRHGKKSIPFIFDITKKTYKGFKQFVGTDKAGPIDWFINKCKGKPIMPENKPLAKHVAGRALFTCAVGSTLLGNFFTLTDFNKYKGKNPNAATSLIDADKYKVVC